MISTSKYQINKQNEHEMKFATSTLATLFLVLIPCTLIFSQRFEMEAGLFLGGANYGGDVVQPDLFTVKETKPAYGLFLRYPLNPQWGLRANMTTGKISGDDRNYQEPQWRQERAFHFKSSLTELALLVEWNPLEKRTFAANSSYNRKVSPYLFGGVAGIFFTPEVDFSQSEVDQLTSAIEADKSGNYTNAQITLPMGMGIKVNASDRLVFGIEGGVRPGFTDYLDGISQSGNPEDQDWYGFAGATVSYRIVEHDSDQDGIADSRDRCPELPGKAKHGGCPDTDLDGIVDSQDECPTIPGKKRMKGCPDSDGDGVADHRDACPGRAGVAANGGCPNKDIDNDGIVDIEDNCPEIAGSKNLHGCPDTDLDGIADQEDDCPTVAGLKTQRGCPKTETDQEPATILLENQVVYFETDRSILLPDATFVLNRVAPVLVANPNYQLHISGFTDSIGDEMNNIALSEQRAKACFFYLAAKGVPKSQMKIVGLGESKPVANNDSPLGRQLNRRAELRFVKQGEY